MSEFRFREMPCPECEGCGRTITTAPVRGEAFDADLCEVRCEACDGEGEVRAYCPGCDIDAPLDEEGFCENCAAVDFVEFRQTGTGGVWL